VDAADMPQDDLFDEAVRVVLETKRGSVSLLQRRLSVGYARASRIIEMMAGAGILGEYKGSQAREVLMTLEEYEAFREQQISSQPEPSLADVAADDEKVPERAYATEGQQGFISTATDEEDE
jgi:DNA segregation ATPase FtsK/SpoIIIE-like protein